MSDIKTEVERLYPYEPIRDSPIEKSIADRATDALRLAVEQGATWERERVKWVKCSDRLPDEKTMVLIAYQGGIVDEVAFIINGKWHCRGDGRFITHWMELPNAPKQP